MKGLLLAALLLAQDGELDRLLLQLGDADPAVRSRASDALAARGADARDVLVKGRDHADPEIRSRSSTLLFRLDQSVLLAKLEKVQRTAKLNRYLVQDWKAPENAVATEGGAFVFSRRPWKPGGGPAVGTIFDTVVHQHMEGEIEWSVAGIRDDRNLVIETCDRHSPASVYIAALPPLPCTVTVKGTKRWYCDVPVSFKGPVNGATHRVGRFALTVQWPDIVVTADAPVLQHIVAQLLKGGEIDCKLRPGVQRQGGTRENLIVRCGLVPAPAIKAWCGCPGKPMCGERPPLPTTTSWKVTASNYARESAEDIESISFAFHNPIEETFEVTSPPLK